MLTVRVPQRGWVWQNLDLDALVASCPHIWVPVRRANKGCTYADMPISEPMLRRMRQIVQDARSDGEAAYSMIMCPGVKVVRVDPEWEIEPIVRLDPILMRRTSVRSHHNAPELALYFAREYAKWRSKK